MTQAQTTNADPIQQTPTQVDNYLVRPEFFKVRDTTIQSQRHFTARVVIAPKRKNDHEKNLIAAQSGQLGM